MGEKANQVVVLGVSGSVAAYRACDLARELMRAGCQVYVCLTDAATKFVSRALFEALTGNPCLAEVFDEPEPGRMAHIDLARKASLLVVCPATANTINTVASGRADDMLTSLALAFEGRMLIAPAMNPSMYANDATRASLRILASRGASIVEPGEGDVACGENGQGKLAPVADVLEAAVALLEASQKLAGRRILVTSGPTQEPLDDVRYLSNRSSGKMGVAVARAALLMGAEVTLITGPTAQPLPLRADVVQVKTAAEMLDACLANLSKADFVVGCAAVADYRPAEPAKGKLRRSGSDITLRLVENPDIIATLAQRAHCPVFGFAAEPDGDLEPARKKIQAKNLVGVAHNDVSQPGIGFDSDQNRLTLVWADGSVEALPLQSKLRCALDLLERLSERGPSSPGRP